ncbi:MAG TPA: ATP-binding protein [Polyangia bacterium]|nr:ATP-binding protein [Polyangia bacterium]
MTKTMDELVEENRRLTALLDAVPDNLSLIDPSNRFLFVNQTAANLLHAMTGLSRSEVIGHDFRGLGASIDLVEHTEAAHARARAGEVATVEYPLPMAGGPRWVETKVSPVRRADGSIEAIAVSGRDIHERKLVETRLRLLSKIGALAGALDDEGVFVALARLAIPELGDWCIVDVAVNGRLRRAKVAHADPALEPLADELMRLDGCDRALRELVARGPFVLADYAGERIADRELRALLERLGARSLLVVPLRIHDELVATATFVAGGASARRYGPEDLALAQELAQRAAQIVENARLHQKLRESEERFRLALAHARITVFELDRELRARWLHNPPLDQPVAPALGDAAAGEPGAAFAAIVRRVIDGGRGVTDEFAETMAGAQRHFLVSVEPLRDASGGVRGAIGAATDITETKRAQEELKQALAFREQMMGVLGHDLRNPLSAVRGLAGLVLLGDEAPAPVRSHVEQIDRAAKRMVELIGTLLDFTDSRFRGGLPIAPAPADLREIATAAIEELRAAHRERSVELDVRGDVRGEWDPARMAQVVSNLVANALTHGAADEPVQVSIAGDADVVLSVRNRGPVIAPEVLPTIFEPFRRGGAADRGPSRGLGLGLYIVDQIVRAHAGTIAVDSTAERGTVFTVRLPRRRAA